ncbi:MAG: hypothetical protein K1W16_12150 [Lachnospiraceae bacterium]
MFHKKNIPQLYRKMNELAYINLSSKQFVWMYDMEWMDYKEVINYKYEEGESRDILPFAFTGGGDKWVFVENSTNEPHIGRCYGGEAEGEYCAKNLEDAIFRSIIEFVSSTCIAITEDGKMGTKFFYEEQVKDILKDYLKIYNNLLPKEYLAVIQYLTTLSFKKCSFANAQWYALLSIEERDTFIERYLMFDLMDNTFDWFPEDL